MNGLTKSVLFNSKGLMTVDFMFGIIITFVIMITLFRVCFSLLVVEVAQYITYSTARAHAASDISVVAQREAGMTKYKSLKDNKVWKHLFKNSFKISNDDDEGILRSGEESGGTFEDYNNSGASDGSELSGIPTIGAVLDIKLSWLNMNIPFLGRTSDADQEFATKTTALLIREPSFKECRDFMKARYEKILQLDPSRFAPAMSAKDKYVALEDNGC